jgi:hypothetical protein
MKLTLKVDSGEGPYEVTTSLYVIVQWERKYKRKMSDLAQGIGAEDLAYLAFEASKLHGVTVPVVFDDFIKKLAAMLSINPLSCSCIFSVIL